MLGEAGGGEWREEVGRGVGDGAREVSEGRRWTDGRGVCAGMRHLRGRDAVRVALAERALRLCGRESGGG